MTEEETMTLEAFADTVLPGEKRSPEDRAIAGAGIGPGAVAAGALDLLREPATGITGGLEYLVLSLDNHAKALAAESGVELETDVPAFVALPYEYRRKLVTKLTAPGHPEKDGWVALALFCNMSFDSAPHLKTADALGQGHPGLTAMGWTLDDTKNGFWQFPKYGYGRKLAELHPDTTASGSPA